LGVLASRRCADDVPPADDVLALVEHGDLPASDGAYRTIEEDACGARLARWGRNHERRIALVPVADTNGRTKGKSDPFRQRDVREVGGVSQEGVLAPEVHRPAFSVDARDERGPPEGHPQSAPLPDREAVYAVVRSDRAALGIDDDSRP